MRVRHGDRAFLAATVLGLALVFAGACLRQRYGGVKAAPGPYRMEPQVEFGLGVNADLLGLSSGEMDVVLAWLREHGFTWVRQYFLWAEMEPSPGRYRWHAADSLIRRLHSEGFEVIAVLGSTPAWARPASQKHSFWTPPEDYAAFGDFVAAFAQRYERQLSYYQVWDQPNIYPFWGDQYVDAAGYSRLLREAATRIRASDRSSWILLAGLAPNVEEGPLNLNELEYLRQVYRSGGGEFFDIAAAKAYGFESGPEDRRCQPEVLNFSRVELLRQVLVELGQQHTPVWAVEFGWNSLPGDWSGRPSIWGGDLPSVQAQRAVAAIERVEGEWPWAGPMLWARLLPPASAADPAYGFALLDRELAPTELGRELAARLGGERFCGSGFHAPDSLCATYGGWRVLEQGADPRAPGEWLEVRFRGTGLELLVRPGPYWAVWYVTVDGQPSSCLPTSEGSSYLVLYDPLGGPRSVTVACRLPLAAHTVRLEAAGGWGQWPLAGWIVRTESPSPGRWYLPLLLAGLAMVTAGAMGWQRGRLLASVAALAEGVEERAPTWLGATATFGAALGFWLAPNLPLTLALAVCVGAAAFVWPSWLLAAVGAWLPFFLKPKALLGFSVMMPELLGWLALVAVMVRWLARPRARAKSVSLGHLDVGVAALVVVGALATAAASNYGVAAHAYRTVIVSAAAFYWGIRMAPNRETPARVIAGVSLGACAAAAVGLWQLVRGVELIEAQGVNRVRAYYGSPNNLALYLERTIPLAMALAIGGRGRRRWLYGGASLIMLAGGLLTRSRGLILLGLPVPLAYLAWRLRLLNRWVALAGAGALLLGNRGPC